MSEIYVERQYWVRWPRVLIVCKKRGRDEEGNLIAERRRYVPEGGTENEWKARCRDAIGRENVLRKERDAAIVAQLDAQRSEASLRAERDGLLWAVDERDQLIRDLLERRCRQSCADCEHEEDDGCEFMRRAVEMGVEVYR